MTRLRAFILVGLAIAGAVGGFVYYRVAPAVRVVVFAVDDTARTLETISGQLVGISAALSTPPAPPQAAGHLETISHHLGTISAALATSSGPQPHASAPSVPPAVQAPSVALHAPVRASDLGANQVVVDGIMAQDRRGTYPVTVLANIPGAVEMRLGNTQQEVNLSEWRPYAAESSWLVRSGGGVRTVFAQYLRADGSIFKTSAVVPEFNEAAGSSYRYPIAEAWASTTQNVTSVLWREDFNTNQGRWASYDWNAGEVYGENAFYPASWASAGYIWTDDSRWRIDWPERPASVFALLNYFSWHPICRNGVDLRGATISFDLRGYGLDLKGGSAFLFVNDINGSLHKVSQPLKLHNDGWSHNSVRFDGSGWERAWQSGEQSPADNMTVAFGISFRDFDGEPTGTLALDNVEIRTRAPGRLVYSHAAGTCETDALAAGPQ